MAKQAEAWQPGQPESDPVAASILDIIKPPSERFSGDPRYINQVTASAILASELTALKEAAFPDKQKQNSLFMDLALHLTALDPEGDLAPERLEELGTAVASFAKTFFDLGSFTRKPGKTMAEIRQAFVDLGSEDCSKERVVNLILEQIKSAQLRTVRAAT